MATVTKLKAVVNNKNLPILGNDGKIRSYYVGRYANKMNELGYNLSNDETNTLESFVNAGISNGWINNLYYFMPIIGTTQNPLTGLVPLIDNIADYELAVDSVDNDLFLYSDSKIIAIGGGENKGQIQLPILEDSIKQFSVFTSVHKTDLETAVGSMFGCIGISKDNTASIALQFGKDIDKFRYLKRISEDVADPTIKIINLELGTNSQINIAFSTYIDNGVYRFIRFVNVRPTLERSVDFMRSTTTGYFPGGSFFIGHGVNTGSICPQRIIAIFDQVNMTSAMMSSFEEAVYNLKVALGKNN